MLVVETIAKIRRAFFVQEKPIKVICRELRVSRKVVRKVIRLEATEFCSTSEARTGRQGRLADHLLRLDLKALKVMRNWPPVSITTDKLGSYPKAMRRLKRTGELKDTVRHRTSKYLNNRIEADHGALKRLIRPARGFQSMKTACATIKGFEVMRMIRRGTVARPQDVASPEVA